MAPVEVRRFTPADLPAAGVEIGRARAAGEFRASSDEHAEFFPKSLAVDPSRVIGALEGSDVVGFASPEFKVVVVRPDRRRQGIGRALIDAARDVERARGRSDVILGVLPDDAVGHAFLRATGFAFHSTLWDLELPAGRDLPAPVWPAGLRARDFDRGRDVWPWIGLFNAAFADHATPLQLDETFVVASLDDPAIRDEDTILLEEVATGELVGFCATAPNRADGSDPGRGEIWTVGVRPGRQGGGLGRQLLRAGVRHLRGIGASVVTLSVNARNEHALGLYESEGFVRTRTRERWALPVGESTAGTAT